MLSDVCVLVVGIVLYSCLLMGIKLSQTYFFFRQGEQPYSVRRNQQIGHGLIIVWLSLVVVGFCLRARQCPFEALSSSQTGSVVNCCNTSHDFFETLQNSYLPSIKESKQLPLFSRRFLVYKVSKNAPLQNRINGLFTAMVCAVLSNREFGVDYPDSPFTFPDWVLRDYPTNDSRVVDLRIVPSPSAPPRQKSLYHSFINGDFATEYLQNRQTIVVRTDDFVVPLLWNNPRMREQMCSLSNLGDLYPKLSSLFLNFEAGIMEEAMELRGVIEDYSLLFYHRPSSNSRERLMLDTILSCADSINHRTKNWVFVGGKSSMRTKFPRWNEIGPHRLVMYEDLHPRHEAVIYVLARWAESIIGFSGSPLVDSVSFAANKTYHVVSQRIAFCGEVVSMIPSMREWHSFANMPGFVHNRTLVSEFISQHRSNL